MRFRTGLIVGGTVGYYLGAKAGRRRYEQLNRWGARAIQSGPVQAAAARARRTVGRGSGEATDPTVDLMRPEWSN